MQLPPIKALVRGFFFLLLSLGGVPAMAYPAFICTHEKDHNPSLDAEADAWFQ